VSEACKVLGVPPDAKRGEVKKAFREKVRISHPDVTGDSGEKLNQVREAFAALESVHDPTQWNFEGQEEGLPAWASGLLNGIRWSEECESYAAFIAKADQKALAVGELDETTGVRPWAAVWGKYSQEDANREAMRICRQSGARCRLVYVGSGWARAQDTTRVDPVYKNFEKSWWEDNFKHGADISGFGWMPVINKDKEQLVGHKNVPVGMQEGKEHRLRVPVFKARNTQGTTGLPYYYTPLKPRKRIYMDNPNFRYLGKHRKQDPRMMEREKQKDPEEEDAKWLTRGMCV